MVKLLKIDTMYLHNKKGMAQLKCMSHPFFA